MPAPHLNLGIIHFSDDQKINDKMVKDAYLQKVHQFPPEQYPEKFRKIREAYELLKDEKARLAYSLFYTETPENNAVLSTLFIDQTRKIPTEKQFLAAFKESLQS